MKKAYFSRQTDREREAKRDRNLHTLLRGRFQVKDIEGKRVNEKEREKMLLHFEKRNFDKKWPNKFLKNVFFNLLFVAVFCNITIKSSCVKQNAGKCVTFYYLKDYLN